MVYLITLVLGSLPRTKYHKSNEIDRQDKAGVMRNMSKINRARRYNLTNTCEFIETDDERCTEKLYPKNARKFTINGKLVWFCERHSGRYRQTLPNSQHNIHKSIANIRTGNLNPHCSIAKGNLFQELTCRWRSTVSTIPVEDLNKKNDNYRSPIDHTPDSELGIIQTKGASYSSKYKIWSLSEFDRDYNKNYDTHICYCINEDGKIIERIYIFPKHVIKTNTIHIYKYDSKGHLYKNGWYEKYRIIDEEIINKVNDIWKVII